MRLEQVHALVDARMERVVDGADDNGTPYASSTALALEALCEGTGIRPSELVNEIAMTRRELTDKLSDGNELGFIFNGLLVRMLWVGYEFGIADGGAPNAELREQMQHLRGAYQRATDALLKALTGLEQIPLMVGTKRRHKAALELLREIREAL